MAARETETIDREGVTGEPDALGTGASHTRATKLDSSAGSTLAPDLIGDVASSLEEDPDMGQLHVEGNVENPGASVDDRTPSDED